MDLVWRSPLIYQPPAVDPQPIISITMCFCGRDTPPPPLHFLHVSGVGEGAAERRIAWGRPRKPDTRTLVSSHNQTRAPLRLAGERRGARGPRERTRALCSPSSQIYLDSPTALSYRHDNLREEILHM